MSDIVKLSKLTRTKIEKTYSISGKSGKDGTTFIAQGPSGKEYAIKLFAATKSSNSIKKEAELQKAAAAEGVAPKVYAVNATQKYIIMEKMEETIVAYMKREYPNSDKRILPKEMQAQLYALCVRLDKAGVVQNDGNPLNLMLDAYNRMFVIDYGFSKKTTPAIIKKRGPQPNINLTLWHFVSQLRHYRIKAPECDRIQKAYMKDYKYVDKKMLALGNRELESEEEESEEEEEESEEEEEEESEEEESEEEEDSSSDEEEEPSFASLSRPELRMLARGGKLRKFGVNTNSTSGDIIAALRRQAAAAKVSSEEESSDEEEDVHHIGSQTLGDHLRRGAEDAIDLTESPISASGAKKASLAMRKRSGKRRPGSLKLPVNSANSGGAVSVLTQAVGILGDVASSVTNLAKFIVGDSSAANDPRQSKKSKRKKSTTPRRKKRIFFPGSKIRFYYAKKDEFFTGTFVKDNGDGTSIITYKSKGKDIMYQIKSKHLNPKE